MCTMQPTFLAVAENVHDAFMYNVDSDYDVDVPELSWTDRKTGEERYLPRFSAEVEIVSSDVWTQKRMVEEWKDVLSNHATWDGRKSLDNLYGVNQTPMIRREAIDRDGDGIIFEGTEHERSIPNRVQPDEARSTEEKRRELADEFMRRGPRPHSPRLPISPPRRRRRTGTGPTPYSPSRVSKALRGPNAPKSINELFRWWAEHDPVAWEQETAEVEASFRRLPKALKKGDYPGHPFRGNQWTKGMLRAASVSSLASEYGDDTEAVIASIESLYGVKLRLASSRSPGRYRSEAEEAKNKESAYIISLGTAQALDIAKDRLTESAYEKVVSRLNGIKISQTIHAGFGGVGPVGMYTPSHKMELSLRQISSIAEVPREDPNWAAPDMFALSTRKGKRRLAALATGVVLHELGHGFHIRYRKTKSYGSQVGEEGSTTGITSYGSTKPEESFAESFCCEDVDGPEV